MWRFWKKLLKIINIKNIFEMWMISRQTTHIKYFIAKLSNREIRSPLSDSSDTEQSESDKSERIIVIVHPFNPVNWVSLNKSQFSEQVWNLRKESKQHKILEQGGSSIIPQLCLILPSGSSSASYIGTLPSGELNITTNFQNVIPRNGKILQSDCIGT